LFKRLLVPLDSSRFSSRALHYAVEIAKCFGAEILLIQIIPSAKVTTVAIGELSPVESLATTEIAAKAALWEDKRHATRVKKYLSKKVKEIRSHGIKGSFEIGVGNPPQSIMELARKERIDLIVMATHGKSGLKRAIIGSVADAVIRKSGKPVLVIRPKALSKK